MVIKKECNKNSLTLGGQIYPINFENLNLKYMMIEISPDRRMKEVEDYFQSPENNTIHILGNNEKVLDDRNLLKFNKGSRFYNT